MKTNDAENLVKIVGGKRTYGGVTLANSQMLWQCTVSGCDSPPKIQRRGQYKDRNHCNPCANRIKSQDPEFLKRRGQAISKAIEKAGPKWSEVASKNMAVAETREKISNSVKSAIRNDYENQIEIRRKTALSNNTASGFGTSDFGKAQWARMSPDQIALRSERASFKNKIGGKKEHLALMAERFPGFEVVSFNSGFNAYRCPLGHEFPMLGNNFIKRGNCPDCAPKSGLERDMFTWAKSVAPGVESNKRVLYLGESKNGNRALEIDIYEPTLKFGIEVHGVYFHRKEMVGELHRRKADLADKHGIQLMQFFEDEIVNKGDIVKSMIMAKLGVQTATIGARDCELVQMDSESSNEFLENNHLQGGCRSFFRVGLKHGGELVSLLTFRRGRGKPEHMVEVARFVTKMGVRVSGGFSRMLKYAIPHLKSLGFSEIMTYSDRRYSSGMVYKNSGFIFKRYTCSDMYWVKSGSRFPREISWGKKDSEMTAAGYSKILGAGNALWVLAI